MTNRASLITILVSFLFFNGCAATLAPKVTNEDKKEMLEAGAPSVSNLMYDKALMIMGKYINTALGYKNIIQPKNILNTSGGKELPGDVTHMVISSLSRLSGKHFVVAPFDPLYINSDLITGGTSSRAIPNLLIMGSITEFDKEFGKVENEFEADILVGGGKTETDLGFGDTHEKKKSRINIDLCIMDYRTHTLTSGACVTNTIHVIDLSRDREYGFAIYGSGLGFTAMIGYAQGFHRSVRNLVDYSILELLGKHFHLPYWKALGVDNPDPDVLMRLQEQFQKLPPSEKIGTIQVLLSRFKGLRVIDPDTNEQLIRLESTGSYDSQTKAFIEAFLAKYAPEVAQDDFVSIYQKLIEHGTFPSKKLFGNQANQIAQ